MKYHWTKQWIIEEARKETQVDGQSDSESISVLQSKEGKILYQNVGESLNCVWYVKYEVWTIDNTNKNKGIFFF